MFRVAVATVLMLLQLAGPLACCCVSGHLTATLSRSSDTLGSHKAKATPSCCGHRAPAEQNQPAPADHRPNERPSCPCCEHSSKVAIVPADTEAPQLQLNPLSSALPADTADRLPALPDYRSAAEHVLLPFVTADDLLRSLHILRC